MGSLKRLTAVFLAVLMLASLTAVGVYAADGDTAATLKVNTTSNIGEAASETYDTAVDSTVTIRFMVQSTNLFANTQGYITYDSSVLEVSDFALSDQFSNIVTNTELYNKITFNATDTDNSADFTENGVFATVTFKILKAGETDVALTIEELNGISQAYDIYGIISDGVAVIENAVSGSAELSVPEGPTQPTDETEATQPTDDTQATQPTEAPQTTIKLTAAKKQIYVNASTTVKATVTNPVGSTSYKSSNTKVATVTSAGKVTGKKAGTVTITATNNGKVATVKIKIVKRANTMTVKAKTVTAKAAKTTSFAKAKAFTIKKAKGTVTFKKAKGDKKITVNKKTGRIIVKKGLKKGKTYSVKVKVTAAGNTAYKAATKTVTVKVKVK